MIDSFELKLRYPFQSPVNKATIDKVTMRLPMRVDDMLVAAKAHEHSSEQTKHIISRMCGLDSVEIGMMAFSDYSKLVEKLGADSEDEEGKD